MPEIETTSSKDRVKEITDKLEKGIKELFEGENFKKYLNTMSKFHSYSFNNTMLIAMQKPDASLVAGFQSWKKNFERSVNKGEKGIQILAPATYTIKEEQEKIDKDTLLPVLDKDGNPVMEEVEKKIPYYKVVSVFDVSQTSGKELPTLGVDELQGGVKDYDKLFQALMDISPVPIKFEQIEGGAKGYFHKADNYIAINEEMSEVQTIKTAIHELAHAKLHNRDLQKSDLDNPKDRNTEEVEAESVAYTVCQHFGIDSSDYSFAYVASWGSGKDVPELKASLETIRATANEIISGIEGKFLEYEKSVEQELTTDKTAEKSASAEKTADEKKSNIIGNVAYTDIADKKFFRLNTETALKVADKLTEQNISFSGRINGDKTTITVDKSDIEAYKSAVSAVTGRHREEKSEQKESVSTEKKPNIIGNTVYKDIPDKTYVKLPTEQAIVAADMLGEKGVNFSGRVNGENTTLTISKSDMDTFKQIEAEIKGGQPQVAQTAPTPEKKSNIIGNTAYKEIEDKTYIKQPTELAMQIAEKLEENGIQFSGRVNGDNTTLTISAKDVETYNKVVGGLLGTEKSEPKSEKTEQAQTAEKPQEEKTDPNIIGNTPYKDITQKNYIKMPTKMAQAVADMLDKNGIQFSGRINGDMTTLTVSKADVQACKDIAKNIEQQKEPEKVDHFSVPLYLKTAVVAEHIDELADYKASMKENIACAKAIDKAISENYELRPNGLGGSFHSDKAFEQVFAEFPLDRIAHIVAARAFVADWDKRYSPEVHHWANQTVGDLPDSVKENFRNYSLNEHSGLVNMFALKVIDKQLELEKEQLTSTKTVDREKDIPTFSGEMPDKTVSIEDMNAYGYGYDGMLPLDTERALELFDEGRVSVYLLYEDGTEGMATDRSDIENHTGYFGVEVPEWSQYLAYAEHRAELEATEPSKEALLLGGKDDTVAIYQLTDTPESRDIRFEGLEALEKKGITPDRENYTLVYNYTADLSEVTDMPAFLESVYDKFNTDLPKDFTGHSLSVSDVVAVKQNGELSAYYVDRAGFAELQNFGAIEKNHLKAIEDTIEQNDNNFDGIINNTPSVAELETKVNNGEQINLTDLAKAVHREKQPQKSERKPEQKRSIRDYLKNAQAQKQTETKDKTKTKGMEI